MPLKSYLGWYFLIFAKFRMNRFIEILKTNSLFVLYTFVFLLLINGVVYISGTTYLPELALYYFTFVIALFLFKLAGFTNKLANNKIIGKITLQKDLALKTAKILALFSLSAIFIHFFFLGGMPGFMALSLETSDEVVKLRSSITEDFPKWLNYIASFNIKGFLPFLVFFFFCKGEKKYYYVLLLIGCLYCFSLMQKSYVVSFLAPLFIFNLLTKNWKNLVLYCLLIFGIIIGLGFTANPEFTNDDKVVAVNKPKQLDKDSLEHNVEQEVNNRSGLEQILLNLYERTTVVPGEMVVRWFETIPENKPFLMGSGYRLLALIKGEEFRNYSVELYPIFYPEFAKKGFKGSMNTASFMYDYANFGKIGLMFSAVVLALIIVFLHALFGADFKSKISINAFSILFLSSAALTTTLFSGGWGVMILLYLIIMRSNESTELSHQK